MKLWIYMNQENLVRELIKDNKVRQLVALIKEVTANTQYSEKQSELSESDTKLRSKQAMDTFEHMLRACIDYNRYDMIELVLSYQVPATPAMLRYAQKKELDNKNFALLVNHCM